MMRSAWAWSLMFALAMTLTAGAIGQDDEMSPPQPEMPAENPEQPEETPGPPEPEKQPEPEQEPEKIQEDKPPADDLIREELLRQLTYTQLRAQKRVLIEMQDAKVSDVVDEFRKQAGFNIILDARNIPEDYRIEEFVVRNAPFREAFNHFLKVAELVIVEETATIIRIERPIMMSLSVTDSDVKEVLGLISKVSGANIMLAPDRITGKITLNVNNVPWTEILDNVVKTMGYVTVREPNIIRIISRDELVRQMETRVFKLRYISPPATYTAKFETSKFVSGSPFTSPTSPQQIPEYFTFLRIVEATLSTDPRGTRIGQSFYDPALNALVVRDTKPVIDRIAQVMQILDVEPEMVMLSMKFVQTRNEDLLNWGTSWFGIDQLGAGIEGFGITTRTTPTVAPTVPGGIVSPLTTSQMLVSRLPFGIGGSDPAVKPFYFLTEYDQRMLFRAFRRDRYTKLLQEPTLSVLDGTTATIFVGESVPFAVARLLVVPGAPTQVFAEPGPGSPVKVGFQVLMVPRVLKDENQVMVTVIPENITLTGGDTQLAGFERFDVGQGQEIVLPRTGETTIVTQLKIDNNQTAVIGGLIVERVSLTERGIPGLKDIPLLGFLFQDKEKSVQKDHLLIFLTPKIVRNRSDLADQMEAQRRLKAAEIDAELRQLRQARTEGDGR